MSLLAIMVRSSPQHILMSVFGVLFITDCIISLKLLELRVPSYVPLGNRTHLSCAWELSQYEVLYSVKWYKDGKEFFRYVPRDVEPRRKFLLPGVDVEAYDLTGANLTLKAAVLRTSGRYRCEVSGEKPLFPTVSDHADLMVIVLPDQGPTLSGFHPRYRPGDEVQVTCYSGRSKPATKLSWYINGELAPAYAVKGPILEEHEKLERTRTTLNFVAKETDFRKNGLKVKCLATLAPLYWQSNEESAIKEVSFHQHMVQRPTTDIRVSRADRVSASSANDRIQKRDKLLLMSAIYITYAILNI